MAFEAKALDDTDWAILIALQANARQSFAELGRQVGLSAPAVAERVRRMEEAGIITAYRAVVEPAKVGYPITVIIQLSSLDRRSKEEIPKLISNCPEVLECINVTGRDCYVIKAVASSMTHVESLLDRLSAYGQTTTSVVLSRPIDGRIIDGRQME